MIGVKIDRFVSGASWAVFIYEQKPEALYILNVSTGIFDKVADGHAGYYPIGDIKPSFVLPYHIGHEVMTQMVKTVTEQFGIGTENEAGLKGKVDAMAAHLADMRRLVFDENRHPPEK